MRESNTVLVTGAAGFFGLAIVRALTTSGAIVIATDCCADDEFAARPGSQLDRLEFVERDLTTESISDLVARADALVHAAALTPQAGERGDTLDKILSVNLSPLPAILRSVRVSGRCSRFVFVSSAGVYDQAVPTVLSEETANGGGSMYGAAKLAAELVVSRYGLNSGLQFCCLRPTSLFGPGEFARPSRPNVTPFKQLVDAAATNRAVRLEHPEARTDWLHVDDAAEAVVALLNTSTLPCCALNVSSGTPTAFGAIAAKLQSTIGLRIAPDGETVVSGGRDRCARIPNDRLRALVGWNPERTFGDAAKAILANTCSI